MVEDINKVKLKPGQFTSLSDHVVLSSHDWALYDSTLNELEHTLNEYKETPDLPDYQRLELDVIIKQLTELKQSMDQIKRDFQEGKDKIILTVNEGFEKSRVFPLYRIVLETATRYAVQVLFAMAIVFILAGIGGLEILEYIGKIL